MQEIHRKFLEEVLARFRVEQSELLHITQAVGRVLASDVRAKHTSPHRDMAAINGYAMMCADAKENGVTLRIIGDSTAGHPFGEELEPGQAVKVYSGSMIPIGADTVVPMLEIEEKHDTITLNSTVMKGQNICYAGVDFLRDEPVLKAGSIITARDVSLAAAMKISWVSVRRKPHIAFFAVGDELAMLGDCQDTGKLTSSSSLMISAFISACGAIPLNLGIAADNEISVNRLMEHAVDADLIITTGGVSASADDLLKKTLDKKTKRIETTVRLSSAATVMLGEKGGIPILALPGNPISAHICATLFLVPIIHAMTDMRGKIFKKSRATLDRDLDINDLQMDYIFTRLAEGEDKHLRAIPASSYDRLLMSALAQSDCVITVDKELSKKGDSVEIKRFLS
jgi:molybdopterin molybdotransferase